MVFDGHIEKNTNMCVSDGVEDLASVSSGSREPCEPQVAELMTRGRFGRTNQLRDRSNAHLSTIDERIDDSQAMRVRQQLESRSEVVCRGVVKEVISCDRRKMSMSIRFHTSHYMNICSYMQLVFTDQEQLA